MSAGPQEGGGDFVVVLENYSGPVEALLHLARNQKVDLSGVDLLVLVQEFERLLEDALRRRIEVAAEWLVWASWLTWLKSGMVLRRLSPRAAAKEADEMDEQALAMHIRRMEILRSAASALGGRRRLGRDWCGPGYRGATRATIAPATLHDILRAYLERGLPDPAEPAPMTSLKPFDLASVDDRRGGMQGRLTDHWIDVLQFRKPTEDPLRKRSEAACCLVASLELAKSGLADVRQDDGNSPVLVRRRAA